ncbi:MAG TPA: hypothetical protein VMV86_03520 [Methanosarcinales archaeon]|nr:hypothetical protein [Methanosarcinales archaeon]
MAEFPFNAGSFVYLRNAIDDNLIGQNKLEGEKLRDFLTRLRELFGQIEDVLNKKDTGFYVEQQFVNGQVFFPNPTLSSTTSQSPTYRQVYRKVIDFGALPNAGTTSVAHGITTDAQFTFTRIYGCATDPSTTYIPLPYASPTAANNIEINADTTNVNITTGSDRTGFTTTYVVIEWINQ